jgi:hypothetical protein
MNKIQIASLLLIAIGLVIYFFFPIVLSYVPFLGSSVGIKPTKCYEKIYSGRCRACFDAYEYNAKTNSCERGCVCDGFTPFVEKTTCTATCVK